MLLRVIQRSSCEMLRVQVVSVHLAFQKLCIYFAIFYYLMLLFMYKYYSRTFSTAGDSFTKFHWHQASCCSTLSTEQHSQLTKHCILKLPCQQELKSNMDYHNQIQRLNHSEANHCRFGTCSVLPKQNGNCLFHHSLLIISFTNLAQTCQSFLPKLLSVQARGVSKASTNTQSPKLASRALYSSLFPFPEFVQFAGTALVKMPRHVF